MIYFIYLRNTLFILVVGTQKIGKNACSGKDLATDEIAYLLSFRKLKNNNTFYKHATNTPNK